MNNDFTIEFLFEKYKDTYIQSKSFKIKIAKIYKLDHKEVHNLFVRIKNYQINKYGNTLSVSSHIDALMDLKHTAMNARTRKYQRRLGK